MQTTRSRHSLQMAMMPTKACRGRGGAAKRGGGGLWGAGEGCRGGENDWRYYRRSVKVTITAGSQYKPVAMTILSFIVMVTFTVSSIGHMATWFRTGGESLTPSVQTKQEVIAYLKWHICSSALAYNISFLLQLLFSKWNIHCCCDYEGARHVRRRRGCRQPKYLFPSI